MRKSKVKPHILSWLQSDPAAGVQPFVFTPNLTAPDAKYRSSLIPQACLASTTSDFLLVDKTRRRGGIAFIASMVSALFASLPYRTLVFTAIVCTTWPLENSEANLAVSSAGTAAANTDIQRTSK